MRLITNLSTSGRILQRKVRQSDETSSFYRYVVSNETNIPMTAQATTQYTEDTEQLRTYRRRYIFNAWKHGNLTADVHVTFRTQVSNPRSREGNAQIISSTSVELELPSPYNAPQQQTLATEIMNIHNGWNVPNLPSFVSSARSFLSTTGVRNPSSLQRPFDITWGDLTYSNLIDKPTAISQKADGYRMLLGIIPQGVFMATSSLDIIPLTVGSQGNVATQASILIDGELVDNSYLAFDVIAANGFDHRE